MDDQLSFEEIQAIRDRDAPPQEDVRAMLARVPPGWRMLKVPSVVGDDGAAFVRGAAQVIMSLSRESDGELWVHVSCCIRTGEKKFALPSWDDMKRVKKDFFGDDAWAYQVFPCRKDYVNIHPCVLHLWARLDGKPVLPDFTKGTGGI